MKCNTVPIKYHHSQKKNEFRVLIRHYFMRKKIIVNQTKEKLYKYYVDSESSISMVYMWFTDCCCGRTSTKDVKGSKWLTEDSTPENVEKSTIWCWPTEESICVRLLMP